MLVKSSRNSQGQQFGVVTFSIALEGRAVLQFSNGTFLKIGSFDNAQLSYQESFGLLSHPLGNPKSQSSSLIPLLPYGVDEKCLIIFSKIL